jgi:hypothetical protein
MAQASVNGLCGEPFQQAEGAQPSGRAGWRRQGPPGCEATRRGKASSCSPSSCTVPTPLARRRGSRAEIAGSSQSVAAAIAVSEDGGCAWGLARAPSRRRGQVGHTIASSGLSELLARAWSSPLKAGCGRCGGAAFQAHGRHPAGQTPGLASSEVRGCGELQPLCGCSFSPFVPRRTRG